MVRYTVYGAGNKRLGESKTLAAARKRARTHANKVGKPSSITRFASGTGTSWLEDVPPSKKNPNIITPLKALIGKTVKIVKRGGAIIGIPVSANPRKRKTATKKRKKATRKR